MTNHSSENPNPSHDEHKTDINPTTLNPTHFNSVPTQHSTSTNQKAVWSLVLGILSLVFCGFLSGIPGWILGVMAKKEIRSSNESGEGMAIAGLVLSIIGTILSIVVIMGYIFIVVIAISYFNIQFE